ncbi:MAG: hypothetical protein ACI8PT_002578 [Gammaproteobacteria bacterium]|jgi:hypothetical protein
MQLMQQPILEVIDSAVDSVCPRLQEGVTTVVLQTLRSRVRALISHSRRRRSPSSDVTASSASWSLQISWTIWSR